MKKLIVIIVALLLLTGCIDYSSNVKLNTDGSGIIEETVLISETFVEMMNSFAQSFGDSTESENQFDIFDEEELKKQAMEIGEGVKYVSGEKIKIDGREGYKALYSFEDISKLKLSDSPQNKMPGEDMMTEETSGEFITFNFQKGNPAVLEVFFPKDEITGESGTENKDEHEEEASDEMITEQMKIFMKDFKISMNLEINGNIVETNATNVENNIVTFFEMDFSELLNMPEKFKKLQKSEPKTMSEAKKLIKDIPGFKVELNDKIFVKFD